MIDAVLGTTSSAFKEDETLKRIEAVKAIKARYPLLNEKGIDELKRFVVCA